MTSIHSDIPHFDIAIIGAGIAGSALAALLDNTSLKIALIEGNSLSVVNLPNDYHYNSFDPRVSAISQANKQLFERLNIWHKMTGQRCQSYHDMHVWDGAGTSEIHFSADEIGESALGYIIENRVIVNSLLARLQMSTNIKLLEHTKIQALNTKDGDYPHLLELRNQQDQPIQIAARLLVGADGANSFVRQTENFKTREWNYGHDAIVCTVVTEKPHKETAWQCFHPDGPVALLPLPSGDSTEHFCSIVWSVDTAEANRLMALDENEFNLALSQATESQLGKILHSSRRFSFPLRQRHAVDYVKYGVVLVADAAHTIHPLAGQGINLGLQDVRVLSEELLRASRQGQHIADMRVLSRYQRRRKADNLLMMSAMEGFKRLFGQRSLAATWIRNTGMRLIADAKPIKKQLIRQAMGIR